MFILGLLEYILTIFKVEFKIWIFAVSTIGYYGGGVLKSSDPMYRGSCTMNQFQILCCHISSKALTPSMCKEG